MISLSKFSGLSSLLCTDTVNGWYRHKDVQPEKFLPLIPKVLFHNQKAPQGGWRSLAPACWASLFFGSSKDLDLDVGSGQGHISMHNTCCTTSMSNHLTVASRSTEIWPFEFHEKSTFCEVWTLVIAFLEGNWKIRLRQAVVQVPYYHHQPSVLSSTPKRRRR